MVPVIFREKTGGQTSDIVQFQSSTGTYNLVNFSHDGIITIRNAGVGMFTLNPVSGVFSLGSGALISATGALSTSTQLQGLVTGDGFARWLLRADGAIRWGSGAGSLDTILYRSAADVLKTDDSLHVTLDLRHLGANLGFYNHATATQQTVTGSRGGNAALASLLTALAATGLIVDSSTV